MQSFSQLTVAIASYIANCKNVRDKLHCGGYSHYDYLDDYNDQHPTMP